MRIWTSLIWKEWRETQIFLWIAWGLFIGLPLIGGFMTPRYFKDAMTSDIVPLLSIGMPMIAIIIGVAGTCRDLRRKLEDFWESRPFGPTALFGVKFFVGAAVVVVGAGVPLIIVKCLARDQFGGWAVVTLVPFCLCSFAMAFAAGCVLRRSAAAAAMGVVGVLLLLFVPVVLPPLSWLSITKVIDTFVESAWNAHVARAILLFFAGTTSIVLLCVVLGIRCVAADVEVQSGAPLIYSAVGASFLILIASASYQVGTDVPVLAHCMLDSGAPSNWTPESVTDLSLRNDSGVVLTSFSNQWRLGNEPWHFLSRTISVGADGITLGPPHSVATRWIFGDQTPFWVSIPQHPSLRYELDVQKSRDDQNVLWLKIFAADTHQWDRSLPAIELFRTPNKHDPIGFLHRWQNNLYVVGTRSFVIDVSQPLNPRLTRIDVPSWSSRRELNDVDRVDDPQFSLPPMPGAPAGERLSFVLDMLSGWHHGLIFSGDLWCRFVNPSPGFPGRLQVLRLVKLDDSVARFELIAQHTPTMIERLLGGDYLSGLTWQENYIYANERLGLLDVFKFEEPGSLRTVGHFAAPGIGVCVPADNGRVVVGATGEVFLLGPPRQ